MPWVPRDDWPPPSRPRRVAGGIRAHAQRGQFAEHWWAQRWLEVLERLELGGRLGRGRSYARSGQVISLDVARGRVTARVQGSRPDPYVVTIEVAPLETGQWDRVADALAARAEFAARLLAGDMPQDVERAFDDAGVPLFPRQHGELVTSCSCPDVSNPCKHIAAVHYLLGEEFDRDPFLIFQLRGRTREALLAALQGTGATDTGRVEPPHTARAGQPLSSEAARYWRVPTPPPDLFGEVSVVETAEAILRRLGRFPFWRAETSIVAALAPVYRDAAARGLDLFVAGSESDPARPASVLDPGPASE